MSTYKDGMTIVLDGNDGTGKSTVAKLLKELGYTNIKDRGAPTKATVKGVPKEIPQDEIYFILDVPEEVSRERIAKRGENLEEVCCKNFVFKILIIISTGTHGKHWFCTEQNSVKSLLVSMPT